MKKRVPSLRKFSWNWLLMCLRRTWKSVKLVSQPKIRTINILVWAGSSRLQLQTLGQGTRFSYAVMCATTFAPISKQRIAPPNSAAITHLGSSSWILLRSFLTSRCEIKESQHHLSNDFPVPNVLASHGHCLSLQCICSEAWLRATTLPTISTHKDYSTPAPHKH